MRAGTGQTRYRGMLTMAGGVFALVVSLPAGAEDCRRLGHPVSEEALCCNMKRVQRCAGARGWADYPTEVCDREESTSTSVVTEPRAGQPLTAGAPAAGGRVSGCYDCEGTLHEPGQTVRNTSHEQVCQSNGKWETVNPLKK
jgi:hypothetical protein